MKKFSRILVVLAVLSMAIGLMTGCGNKKSEKSDNQSSVEQIKKNGKIKVGVPDMHTIQIKHVNFYRKPVMKIPMETDM